MPILKPVAIPPNAILDPDACRAIGTPHHAWHPQLGKIAVSGGGLARLAGLRQNILTAGAGVTLLNGGAKGDSTANGKISAAVQTNFFAITDYLCVWVLVRFSGGFPAGGILWDWSSTTVSNGVRFGMSSSTSIAITHGGRGSSAATCPVTLNQTELYSILIGHSGPMNNAFGVARVFVNGVQGTDGAAFTNAINGQPASPQLAFLGRNSATNGSLATLYGLAAFKEPPSLALARALMDPAVMWWWPGKDKNRTYSMPPAAVATTRFYYDMGVWRPHYA